MVAVVTDWRPGFASIAPLREEVGPENLTPLDAYTSWLVCPGCGYVVRAMAEVWGVVCIYECGPCRVRYHLRLDRAELRVENTEDV